MDFMELVQKRYSVRQYLAKEVEQKKLDAILEAARLAPTAANRQAFKILVISTASRKEELKKIYPSNWFVEAPYILGICSIPEQTWIRKDGKEYGDVDTAIVMDHMILAASALGLGTCWIAAFNPDAAKQVLDLDSSWTPVAFTPLGYATSDGIPEKKRKPIDDLVVYI